MKELFILLSGLVIVSSCHHDEFQCQSGKCLPAHAVCDFKNDCDDGLDEEFCGTCDFEHHTCGWNDSSTSSYRWRRQMANITTVPGQDHTSHSPHGHVMHINGTEGGMFPIATLDYLVVHQGALACQLSFWYHIFDNETLPSSSTLKVQLMGDAVKDLLVISDSVMNSWKKATVAIGNQPAGYKLRFTFERPFLSTKDVMLDDIEFENCGEEDVPDGSDRLSCDFQKDTCSWYHDYTAELLWKRDKKDNTDSNGYYMVVKAVENVDISSTARLKSIQQPATQVICVSFWYHIFGNSIGSLKFISQRSGEPQTVAWMRSGTQGNKWRFADLTFTSGKPIQFTIEAIMGGDQGSIAIDGIEVTRSENSSCPPERECTFQGSLCGLQPQPSTDFQWERTTGTSQPANSSGPVADHTLRTEHGYYLSAQLWRHTVGARGTMATALMGPTPAQGECLMFWYYMEGNDVGELSVHLQSHSSPANPKQLWTRKGDQGGHWRHGRVTLLSPQSSYQVVFEAKVGEAERRDVAIDDLTVLNDACPPVGFCDFEMDLCGWVNNPPPESGVDWDWLSGESDVSWVPKWDHTTESALGHFAFVMSSESGKEKIAQLESESMEAVERACLEMWHYSSSWLDDYSTHLTLTVFLNESSELRPVWNTSGFSNATWIRELVDYSSLGPHQIVLQVRCPGTNDEGFSLDDVHIVRNKSCSDLTVTTTTTPPSTSTTTAPSSAMDCDFEKGLCNWVQEDNDDSNWTLTKGVEVDQPWDGPEYDHTVENNQGVFLLLNGSGSINEERAVVSVPIINPASEMCVGFWYYMLGPSVSTLDILVQTESSELLLWTRRGTQNPEWMEAQVTISMNNTEKLMLAGHRNTESRGFIAIDDVTIREGACSVPNPCGFDSGLCGFQNSVSSRDWWVRRRGTKDHVDHTYATENGFYMMVVSNSTQLEVAQLLSPAYAASEGMCVRFWYWLSAGSSNGFSIHVLRSGELGEVLWQRQGPPTDGWEVAEVTVFSPLKFHVVFQTNHVPGSSSTVRIDDYSLREGACTPTASCDFESGQCTWVNVPVADGHDWVLTRGGLQGPSADHTTQTLQGWFLLSSAQHSSVAQLTSEWIQVDNNTSCLTFWYHMDRSHSGTLRVLKRLRPLEDELIFQGESSQSSWRKISQPVETSESFQLLIEARSNNRGFIAIDDIALTPGSCQVNDSSSWFVGCSFENGTCDWEDISVGPGQWVRGRNASRHSGPSVDHTLGTELGWYMAVEADRGDQLSPAALQSPTLKQASAHCMLHFYYNMFGEGIDDLKVLLKEGSRSTTLWWLSGNRGDSWQFSEVTVGRVLRDFTIEFEASRTFDTSGHIALDDVDFFNCSLPEPQPSCPPTTFRCNNSVCVKRGQVCDFSDDCGDWTDENHCEQQGVLERCSFEQGLCFWAESDVDRPGGEWRIHTGQGAWPSQGPPRDHTHNSAAGHYVIPGTHLEMGQTSEILSRTLLPSLNCTVRLFYFSLNDTWGGLAVRLRTQQSGSGDVDLWLRATSQSYSWHRAELTFTSSANSKVVFSYELGEGPRGLVALDDISFSSECTLDPNNSQLHDTPPTSPSPIPSVTPDTSTTPVNPCQVGEFFCWQSAGTVCVLDAARCDYHPDCPLGEDEAGCGPCTFESDQCQWTVSSDGHSGWQRLRASSNIEPPTDHTTGEGYYMRVNLSPESMQSGAMLQSPRLHPSSPYCQILFHFHISATSAGSLTVLMQQAEDNEAILWSRSHNTVSRWIPEHLPLGLQRPYKVWFSNMNGTMRDSAAAGEHVAAVDDISFVNCEKSYEPPVLPSYGCSFEKDLCTWLQGAEDELDWLLRSGPAETLNTGPAGDHTTGQGKYLHMDSSASSVKGNIAQLKSLLLPPAGEKGYCVAFWYHMFGPTVGSLRMFLQTADPLEKQLVWQKSGNQEAEWRAARTHVTLLKVHQVTLEATMGGEAGDIAIDDISFTQGPCPATGVCDFEEGSCDWQQQTNDDFDWVRQSGRTPHPNKAPEGDHTTDTAEGHYYYLPSLPGERAGQRAVMVSPLYPAVNPSCVQLWYHMSGKQVGTLKVYQRSEGSGEMLIFSQTGNQGRVWRLAQAPLYPHQGHPYQIVVEGVKAGPDQEGGIAFDDVVLTDVECPPPEFCNFESNMCRWSNHVGGADHGDWLRGRGASTKPSSGPSVDHTTNSSQGYYVYVDSHVGQWGDTSFLTSDVLQPSTRGHCLTFWYHMYGDHVGTLKVFINDWNMHTAGNEEGDLKWIEAGNKGERWHQASLYVKPQEAFWFVFVYQRGMNIGGDVALDDITIIRRSCFSDPPTPPSDEGVSIGLVVGLTFLAGLMIFIFLLMLNWKWTKKNQSGIWNDARTDQNSGFTLSDCVREDRQHRADSDMSFHNILYEPPAGPADSTGASSDI